MYIFSPPAGSPRRIRTALAFLVLALALTGCASVPPPNDSMNMAQTQLQMARDAGAADYAPVDLGFAQDKFQLAQAAMAERKYADAASLAEESRADAELAQAKARLGAARAQIQSKVQENTRLRQQGEQAAAAAQAPPSPPPPSSVAPPADMPAPSSSVLSAPPADGFQTVPDTVQQPAANSHGGQP
ncbi:DUF4398 domain-containing protein [Rhodanobacter sp. B2A1Ga4]|uniref:DUF4398 domain-containing protein n=1 Tax=Rhodanobacter sp. B2A1Ga4 TaxID=2778647 RepID=UPI001B37D159|nr:DUF4398 domain-containing protein [Rhodanobacter sp. B2A1Ga4]MBQ4856508.1 DUF4398 domain-containing protein [Rhodanobacter sp. B2A1Ga4]